MILDDSIKGLGVNGVGPASQQVLEWALKRRGTSACAMQPIECGGSRGERLADLAAPSLGPRPTQIDGAHAVAHKDEAAATSPADPLGFLERLNATAKPH